MVISILKIAVVIAILVLMIIVLLSVNHFLRGDFDSKQSDIVRMRDEVEKSDRVISEDSVFRNIVKVPQKHSKT